MIFFSESGKARDDKFFSCQEEHESYYVSNLYKKKEEVHEFLEKKCKEGKIKYSTHEEVYEMLENEGYERK